jgi:Phage capsid family
MPTDPSSPAHAPLTPQTAGLGYELTPTEWSAVIYGPLRVASAVLALDGVQVHEGYGPFVLPRMTTAAPLDDTYWAAPNDAIAEVDLATSGATLLPRGLKALKAIPRVPAETLRSSVGSPIDAAQTAIVNEMVRVLDAALLRGNSTAGITGLIPQAGGSVRRSRTVTDAATTSGSPTLSSATAAFSSADVGRSVSGAGIPTSATIASVTNATTAVMSANATATATGVTVTIASVATVLDDLQDALTLSLSNWARPTAWLINPTTLGALYKLKDADGRQLIAPSTSLPVGPGANSRTGALAGPGSVVMDVLLGRKVIASPAVPAGTAVLLQEDEVHIGLDLDRVMRILDQTYARYDQVGFLIVSRWDIAVVNPYAVVAVTGLATS